MKNWNYGQAINYLESFIHYEKTPPAQGGKKTFDLAGFRRLLDCLGNPHEGFRVMHVAGTKGKGSTCAMAAAILREQGYKTGLYTSPHLISYRERIQIDGQWISEKRFVRQIQRVQEAIERGSCLVSAYGFNHFLAGRFAAPGSVAGQPIGFPRRKIPRLRGPMWRPPRPPASSEFRTTFEILTAAALLEFAEQEVDIAVIETGLGGMLDATNVVQPDVAVLTSISLDHTQILGNSIAQIAKDKAGILKPGCIAVIGPQPLAARKVIQQVCKKKKIKALWHGKDWRISNVRTTIKGTTWDLTWNGKTTKNLFCPLPGRHQAENGSLAILTAASAGCCFSGASRRRSKLGSPVPEKQYPALAAIHGIKNIQWPGRFQILPGNLILDGAHNPESAKRLVQTFREVFPKQKCVLVLGVSVDKDLRGMLGHLRTIASTIIATKADIPRAMPVDTLARACARMRKGRTLQAKDAKAALALARKCAMKNQKILATGSLFLVGDLLRV